MILFALINSTISLYYYIRIIKVMIVDEPSEAVLSITTESLHAPGSRPLMAAMTVCVVMTLLLGIFANKVYINVILDPAMQLQQVQRITSQAPQETQLDTHKIASPAALKTLALH